MLQRHNACCIYTMFSYPTPTGGMLQLLPSCEAGHQHTLLSSVLTSPHKEFPIQQRLPITRSGITRSMQQQLQPWGEYLAEYTVQLQLQPWGEEYTVHAAAMFTQTFSQKSHECFSSALDYFSDKTTAGDHYLEYATLVAANCSKAVHGY